MKDKFQVHITKPKAESLTIFCKYHNISIDDHEQILTKLLESEVERILHGSQDVKSSMKSSVYEKQVQFLEGWDCPFRFAFDKYHNPTKEWHRKVLCSSSKTGEIVRLIELDTEVCKQCNERSVHEESLPYPEYKKVNPPSSKALANSQLSLEKIQPYPKKRICVDCNQIFLAKKREDLRCPRCWNNLTEYEMKPQTKEE